LQIPKIRQGSYFPSILEPRRRSEQALLGVIQQAYVCGVSTRRVDQLVESLGLPVSKSEVSRICGALDEHVDAFRTRPLEGRYPYLFLDAKVEKVRDGGRVVNKALVIAHGVHETGRREILSIDVGEAETEAFWTEFLRDLVKRGLVGVQLAISDAHAVLKAAIAKLLGCAWQRCTVHASTARPPSAAPRPSRSRPRLRILTRTRSTPPAAPSRTPTVRARSIRPTTARCARRSSCRRRFSTSERSRPGSISSSRRCSSPPTTRQGAWSFSSPACPCRTCDPAGSYREPTCGRTPHGKRDIGSTSSGSSST
jgi:hypothetical protein